MLNIVMLKLFILFFISIFTSITQASKIFDRCYWDLKTCYFINLTLILIFELLKIIYCTNEKSSGWVDSLSSSFRIRAH